MKNLASYCFIAVLFTQSVYPQSFTIRYNTNSIQQRYAVSKLEKALLNKGYKTSITSPVFIIKLTLNNLSGAESFSIQPSKQTININGGDERGLIYGCLYLAEDIRNGISLKDCKSKTEKPFLPFRAIKYDLPWDTYRHSYALELHDQTCRDTAYWRAFLDMMAENRFNTLTLWNLHPYPFLIKSKNFPEASPWNENEMKEWQRLFIPLLIWLLKERLKPISFHSTFL